MLQDGVRSCPACICGWTDPHEHNIVSVVRCECVVSRDAGVDVSLVVDYPVVARNDNAVVDFECASDADRLE